MDSIKRPEGLIHLIIAGNYSEFNFFCDMRLKDFGKGNNLFAGDVFYYYSTTDSIRGIRFYNAYCYGTHFWRKDVDYDFIKTVIRNKLFYNELIWKNGHVEK